MRPRICSVEENPQVKASAEAKVVLAVQLLSVSMITRNSHPMGNRASAARCPDFSRTHQVGFSRPGIQRRSNLNWPQCHTWVRQGQVRQVRLGHTCPAEF